MENKSINEEQQKLANEISEILKDQNITPADRLNKMKAKLNPKVLDNEPAKPIETKNENLGTYGNNAIRKAALRNQILNKNEEV
jgi:hypothetical protein